MAGSSPPVPSLGLGVKLGAGASAPDPPAEPAALDFHRPRVVHDIPEPDEVHDTTGAGAAAGLALYFAMCSATLWSIGTSELADADPVAEGISTRGSE